MLLIASCSKEPEPKSSFTIDPNPAYARDTVYFQNNSSEADAFIWHFGDGTFSELENPAHVYSEEGEYTVSLKAINSEISDSSSLDIIIVERWEKHVIDASLQHGVSVDLADFDGDGDTDLLVNDFLANAIYLYDNDALTWTRSEIETANDGRVVFAYSGDMDNDGRMDVVATYPFSWDLVLYRNGTNGWEEHFIDDDTKTAEFFSLIDMNGDKKLDVVAGGGGDYAGPVKWYENQYPDWIEHIIDAEYNNYRTTWVVDIDKDDLLDVAATMNVKKKVVWYKNEGIGAPWTLHTIDENLPSAFGVNSDDVNGDNVIDLLVTTGGPYEDGGEVFWYENKLPNWTRHEIDLNLDGALWPQMADINGNDKTDIIVTGYYANKVVWYEQDHQSWNEYLIDDNVYRPCMIQVTDLNKDNLNDIIISAVKSIVWYEQKALEP